MYAIKNRVQLIGKVREKPIIREAANGTKWARVFILVEDGYFKAKGVYVKEDQKHTLVVQGRIAALVEKSLEKGMEVAVSGRLVNRLFYDSKGERKCVTEVLVKELLILNVHWQEQDEG